MEDRRVEEYLYPPRPAFRLSALTVPALRRSVSYIVEERKGREGKVAGGGVGVVELS